MLAFARDLDVQYKTAFVLAHKLREAMASSVHALSVGGDGRTAEIDGAYFGGHIRPENLTMDRVDRRLAKNRPVNRRVVVVMRERGGRSLAQVFAAETTLAHAVLSALRPDMLCLADRQFFGHALWQRAAASGADLL